MQIYVTIYFAIFFIGVLPAFFLSVHTKTLSIKRLAQIIIGSVLLLLGVIWLPPFCLTVDGYAVRHLEENARKVTTGDELQTWATNVLANPDNYKLRSEYPSGLRWVHPQRNPRVSVHTNLESGYVALGWDEVDINAELEVGPTNFVGAGHKWQDGVYFLFDH